MGDYTCKRASRLMNMHTRVNGIQLSENHNDFRTADMMSRSHNHPPILTPHLRSPSPTPSPFPQSAIPSSAPHLVAQRHNIGSPRAIAHKRLPIRHDRRSDRWRRVSGPKSLCMRLSIGRGGTGNGGGVWEDSGGGRGGGGEGGRGWGAATAESEAKLTHRATAAATPATAAGDRWGAVGVREWQPAARIRDESTEREGSAMRQ